MLHTDALHYVGLYSSPAAHISLRAIDPDRFTIVNEVTLAFVALAPNQGAFPGDNDACRIYTGVHLECSAPHRLKLMAHAAGQAAGGEILEEIEESKAFWEVYDGAVYMFQVGDALLPLTLRYCAVRTQLRSMKRLKPIGCRLPKNSGGAVS